MHILQLQRPRHLPKEQPAEVRNLNATQPSCKPAHERQDRQMAGNQTNLATGYTCLNVPPDGPQDSSKHAKEPDKTPNNLDKPDVTFTNKTN